MRHRPPAASAAHDDWVAEARAVPLTEVAARLGVRLKREGRELVGPCPVCGGQRDKLALNPDKGVWVCGHTGGEGGDAIDLVRHLEACSFVTACEILTGRPKPGREAETPEERAERDRARAARQAQATRSAAEREQRRAWFRERERQRARAIWERGQPIAGSIVERYLAHRGITRLPPGARLRALSEHAYHIPGPRPDDPPRLVGHFPAMLAAIVDADGIFRGVHQTWLDPRLGTDEMPEAASGKAIIVDPETGEVLDSKKVRGSTMECRIELVRGTDAPRWLYCGEGIETVLSVWQALVEARPDLLVGAAFWSAISLGNLAGGSTGGVPHPVLQRPRKANGHAGGPVRVPGPEPDPRSRAIRIPDSIEGLILLGDGDSEPFATSLALERAARRHGRREDGTRREVRIAMAPEGLDFNAALRARTAEEMAA